MTNDTGFAFLTGAALTQRIRDVCLAPDVACAVAFWGTEMRQSLFPHWPGSGCIRIVCDISQGATCQQALRELGAPNNANLKDAQAFHGKVFISSYGAIVGSANASDNGVGRNLRSQGKLLEAGVFCPPGSSAYDKATEWFKELFDKTAKVVDAAILAKAPERSNELRPRAPMGSLQKMPLLQRIRKSPQDFPNVRIAIATGHINEKTAAKSVADRLEARGGTLVTRDAVILQNDNDLILRPLEDPLVLVLWRLKTKTTVWGYTNCSTWPPEQPDTVFGIDDWNGFWGKLQQIPPQKRLSDEESEIVGSLLALKSEEWIFSADELSQRLAATEADSI